MNEPNEITLEKRTSSMKSREKKLHISQISSREQLLDMDKEYFASKILHLFNPR
jgi:hypothetical protein